MNEYSRSVVLLTNAKTHPKEGVAVGVGVGTLLPNWKMPLLEAGILLPALALYCNKHTYVTSC